ncbi:MAG: hypothetical protein KatS3mg004_0380 [Bryobacteraceae bacterium]|nr:MAG: hypothetical protein KatS3mg004_0380 [Bryobacteraceae bacterium]
MTDNKYTTGFLSPATWAPPEFPLSALPPAIGAVAEAVAHAVGCPVEFAAGGALAAMSFAVGSTRGLEIQPGWVERPSLYIALVGPSGSGKTPALNAALAPARRLASQLNQDRSQCEVVAEATTEALALLLRDRPRGVLLHADELSALFEGFGAYRGGRGADRQFYCSAWGVGSFQITRVQRSQGPRRPELIEVRDPLLSIVGGLVPERLNAFGSGPLLNDGLPQRFLFFLARETSDSAGSPSPPEVRRAYEDLIEKMARLRGTAYNRESNLVLRKFSPSAGELFRQLAADLRESAKSAGDAALCSYGPKLVSLLARLALLLHEAAVADGADPDVVDEAPLWGAYFLADFALESFHRVLQILRAGVDLDRCKRLARAAAEAGGEISAREVYSRHIAGVRSAAEAAQLFADAERLGFGEIAVRVPATGGHPQTFFRVRFSGQRSGVEQLQKSSAARVQHGCFGG